MIEPKYAGEFTDRASVAREFAQCADKYATPTLVVEGFPTDAEILHASYEVPGYEGYGFVLYERDGKLYEVNGSHCSCYGLEGQWNPEETSWAALAIRKHDYSGDTPTVVIDEAKRRVESAQSADAVK